MTLYRGQLSIHKDKPFVPALFRDGIIQKLEKIIIANTNLPDLDAYKQALSEFSVSKCPGFQNIADKDHLFYFFLSTVNISLKIQKNCVLAYYPSTFFDQFITLKDHVFTLPSPDSVQKKIEKFLVMESIFDGEHLKYYAIFQHLNFIFPDEFPTLLLDWTSDFDIAEYFSRDASGKTGTIVSIEYPKYPLFGASCHFSGTTNDLMHQTDFYNAFGYACDNYECDCETKTVDMSDGRRLNFQVNNAYSSFNHYLITTQKATCLYWPYRYTLEQLDAEQKETLGFKILTPEEIQEHKTNKRKYEGSAKAPATESGE
jgi:hypothetical protein